MRPPRRRPRAHQGPSHERWLVSYADFITLLFAFFTVLYAGSTLDARKLASVVDSMQAVFGGDVPATPPAAARPNLRPPSQPAPPLENVRQDLARELSEEVRDGRITVDADPRGVIISIRESGSFTTGSADVPPALQQVIARIGDRLRTLPNAIRVEGHTDDVPIGTSRYSSNWELSTARATGVVAFLIGTSGIDPARLGASGYAEFRPRVPNTSPENRALNRRVDIAVLNDAVRSSEEPAATSR